MPVSRKVCDVGSGPIAWAEVFGYLDRRSHAHSDKFQSGSQTIYACGDYGTDGKPRCVAPSGGSTFRQRGYTNAIAKIMDSECQNEDTTIGDESWTPIAKMVKVKAFFQARQKTGTPRVEKTKLVWKMPGDKVYMRDRMVGWVKAGWPVIVGTDEAGKRHYAVVTAFRRKSRKVRKCSGTKGTTTSCKAWYYRYKNYQMFTHQGDGTNGNRWQSINIHFLITAKYWALRLDVKFDLLMPDKRMVVWLYLVNWCHHDLLWLSWPIISSSETNYRIHRATDNYLNTRPEQSAWA